jgi:unsaturated rhamnogalacturonyl hydrolase
MAKTRFALHSTKDTTVWDYVSGTILEGFAQLYQYTGDTTYRYYIKNTVDYVVSSSGKINGGYSFSGYTLDNIAEGRMLLMLYQKYGTAKYKTAADTLRKQLSGQSRTTEGGFWHKLSYPSQMWLDGIYMASPFYAEYGKIFSDTAAYTDVVKQVTLVTKHTRDTATNLMYHGWDETKTMAWADSTTGTSKTFWARAMGWYMMALVDILDDLPADHPGRTEVLTDFQNLAKGIKTYQDAGAGTWYQVVDKGSQAYNYHECSASCIYTYALAKGYRMGYLDSTYYTAAKKGYTGILNSFIRLNADSTIQIDSICKSASLTYTTSDTVAGSYAYYTGQTSSDKTTGTTVLTANEGKGIGPFMMASVEMERMGFVVPPQSMTAAYDSVKRAVTVQWTDKAPNAVVFYIERKLSGDAEYTVVKQAAKGHDSVIDTLPSNGGLYYYRVRAKSDSLYSDYSNSAFVSASTTTSAGSDGQTNVPWTYALDQNYPNPFNPSTVIGYRLAASSHVTLKIYDLLGREAAVLVNAAQRAGVYSIEWNAAKMTSGVYFYKLNAGSFTSVKKLLFIK